MYMYLFACHNMQHHTFCVFSFFSECICTNSICYMFFFILSKMDRQAVQMFLCCVKPFVMMCQKESLRYSCQPAVLSCVLWHTWLSSMEKIKLFQSAHPPQGLPSILYNTDIHWKGKYTHLTLKTELDKMLVTLVFQVNFNGIVFVCHWRQVLFYFHVMC